LSRRLAIAGKGGSGKTTLAALLISYLIDKHPGRPILAVDADPNANLNEALGLEVTSTIGTILEDTKKPGAVPTGMTKDLFVEYRLSMALVETSNFDLVTMGNPQGPGCYCYPNDLLKRYLERLSSNYEYLVIDNEAGLEHLSRRLLPQVDLLLVTSDATARGIRSAARVKQIVDSVKIEAEQIGLVVSRSRDGEVGQLNAEIERSGLTLLGEIPYDPRVAEFDLQGRPLLNLPPESESVRASRKLFDNLPL
jgi:CO dehydrogenase maturation factor